MSLQRGQQNENNISAVWAVFRTVDSVYSPGTWDYHLGRSEEKEMRIVNERAGVRLESMAEGEIFIEDDDYWLITDYRSGNNDILCANLSSGFTIYLGNEKIVIPVTAEVHIL